MQVKQPKIAHSQKGKYHDPWFIGRLLTARVPLGSALVPKEKCIVNSTLFLVTATSPALALHKLEIIGHLSEGKSISRSGTTYAVEFLGVVEFTPVYEPIADGCELLDEGDTVVDCSRRTRNLPSKDKLLSDVHRIEKRRRRFGCMPMWNNAKHRKK